MNIPIQNNQSNIIIVCLRIRFFSIIGLLGILSYTADLHANDINGAPVTVINPSADSTPAPLSNDASASAASEINSMEALNDQTKLSNGDKISYRVVEEKKDPIPLTVSDSGEIEVPLVGRIAAADKTCKKLAYELKPLLEKEYFYHATVIVGVETLSKHPKGKVYLMGQVHNQGAVEIPADEKLTVSKAILLEGGLADFADRHKVKLVRKNTGGATQTMIVDLVEILDKGHVELDPILQPDDLIIVPERLINF